MSVSCLRFKSRKQVTGSLGDKDRRLICEFRGKKNWSNNILLLAQQQTASDIKTCDRRTLCTNDNIAAAKNKNKTKQNKSPSRSKICFSIAVHFSCEAARQQQVQKCGWPRRSAERTTKAAMGKEERKRVEETRRGLPVTVETNLSLAVVIYFERHLEKTGKRHSISPASQKEQ